MPTASVGWLDYIAASPAGNLLALGGTSGLQVFYFINRRILRPASFAFDNRDVAVDR